jgi:hypothetical protein
MELRRGDSFALVFEEALGVGAQEADDVGHRDVSFG